ncbi:MAG: undecaprenyldiphospho-muramoylpentapeptide beta-N-acetylglucosaminyltransferase [Acidobacteria bacterium]|nr:undecaprenyldiphospho-muramoylpentapeptide beta-N-acetylglucosaminyltransferase [Acidobacteriota bacterium]
MDYRPRVLLSGGGTGGHLYPGIAVAEEMQRRYSQSKIVFIGTGRRSEAETVISHGFKHQVIRSAGLKGKSLGAFASGLAVLPWSVWDAWSLVTRVSPHLVIGLGGYAAGAVVLVAALRQVPTMILEQNAMPGVTNRLLAPVVRAAAVSYEMSLPHFRGKGFVAGNPVRSEFFKPDRSWTAESGTIKLLVLGGSQGAHPINLAMMSAAPKLVNSCVRFDVTHQTGEQDCERVQGAYEAIGLSARVEPYLNQMAERMREADLIISRAGATTLAEVAAVGRPALLVPLPGSADGHQLMNAEVLVRAGAAEMLPQSALTGDRLASTLVALAADSARRFQMAGASRKQSRPGAVSAIVDRAEQLMGL